MSRRLVLDTESDGLLREATKFHCIVAKDVDTGEVFNFFGNETVPGHHGSVDIGLSFISEDQCALPIGHNIIAHDYPLIRKLTGKQRRGRMLDTLVLSRACNADRRLPPGCPTTNAGSKGKVGPHSLQAWGYRVGRGKPEHNDWTEFSEAMLHRCKEDAEINHLTLEALLKEVGVASIDELPDWVWVEMRVAQLLQEQEERGWMVDKQKIQKNIAILKDLISVLEAKLEPNLPWVAKPAESKEKGGGTYKYVKKPFLKSGAWSKSVKTLFPEFISVPSDCAYARGMIHRAAHWSTHRESGQYVKFSIGGPFCRVIFRKVKLTSDQEIKDLLLKLGWRPLEWNYSKKTHEPTSPKLTEESMDLCKDKVGKVGMMIMQYTKACHRLSNFEGWLEAIQPNGRIHAAVNGQGCPTARMTHKTIVNVPSPEKKSFFAKKMREVFIASPGYTLVGTDAVSCQVRMLCHYMGDDEFTDIVLHGKKEEGTDIHSYNRDKAGLPTRGHAKNFFYGFIFGAGPAKIGKLIGKDKKAGQQIIDNYLAGLPKLKALKDGLRQRWKERGFIYGLDGRKLYPRKENDLLCYLLQGAEAILMKWAMCYAAHWIEQEGLDAHLVCVMHDEYTWETRQGQEDRVKYLTQYAIQKAGEDLGLIVPADGDPADGPDWKAIH